MLQVPYDKKKNDNDEELEVLYKCSAILMANMILMINVFCREPLLREPFVKDKL